jgi:hypothetical protein
VCVTVHRYDVSPACVFVCAWARWTQAFIDKSASNSLPFRLPVAPHVRLPDPSLAFRFLQVSRFVFSSPARHPARCGAAPAGACWPAALSCTVCCFASLPVPSCFPFVQTCTSSRDSYRAFMHYGYSTVSSARQYRIKQKLAGVRFYITNSTPAYIDDSDA